MILSKAPGIISFAMTRRGEPRTELELEMDYEKETALLLRGHSHRQIAKAVGLTQPQVSLDLKVVRERLLERSTGNMDQWQAEEIARSHMVESEAWREWEKSKRPRSSKGRKSATGDKPHDEEWEKQEGQRGDPRYLDAVQKAQDLRVRLRGLEAPKQLRMGNMEGSELFSRVTFELQGPQNQAPQQPAQQAPQKKPTEDAGTGTGTEERIKATDGSDGDTDANSDPLDYEDDADY